MSNAADAYRGEAGAAYWRRNAARVRADQKARAVALRSLLPEPLYLFRWLEIGAGRGDNLMPGDVAFDCDARQLEHVRSRIIPVIGEAHDLPFPNRSFHVVVTVGCLMHLTGDTLDRAMAELCRVSCQYLIIGEYHAETQSPIIGRHWDTLLWQRPYLFPAPWQLITIEQPLAPFDPEVAFHVWENPCAP